MCRIASLLLLQRLKRKHVRRRARFQQDRDASCHQGFFFLQGKTPKEIHTILTEALREYAPSYATVKNRVTQFKSGDFFTWVAPRPGRPKAVTTPEIIDQIHELILEDHQISTTSIAEQLGISHERVGSIIHKDLDMRKLSAKWVPKCLNADQKRQRWQSSEQNLDFFGMIQKISCRDWWPWDKPGYITLTRRQTNNQWSPTLLSGSDPFRIPPVSWTEKTIERSPFLVRRGGQCWRGDLVGRTTF